MPKDAPSTTAVVPAGPVGAAAMRLLDRLVRWQPWVLAVVALLVGVLLSVALRDILAEVRYEGVVAAMRATAPGDLALALVATAVSYLALTGYDRSAMRYVNAAVPYAVIAPTSFVAYALGNTIGLGVLTGGAVRMRMYTAAGIDAGAVSRAIAYNAAAFGLGIVTIGAAAVLWSADSLAPAMNVPLGLLRSISGLVLAALAALLWLCRRGTGVRVFGLNLPLPRPGLAVQQLLLSAVDIASSAAVLWVLLPAGVPGFAPFVGFYAMATVAGVASHVPGGLGVFEGVMLLALGGQAPAGAVAGALVLYRVIYYVIPLALALALVVTQLLRGAAVQPLARAAASLSPLLLAAFTLVIGSMLVFSGVTPSTPEATALLALHVPLPLVEASHFLGSIAGLVLLLVAQGMLRRLDAAWWAGLLAAATGLGLALPKGLAVSEAALLAVLTTALALSRRQFSRPALLLAQPFSSGWLLAVGGVLAAATGLLFFAYRDVAYSHELWWQFEFDAHAPRSLRALVATELLALLLAARQLLRPPSPTLQLPDAATLERAAGVVQDQEFADACLALTGDKPLLFSDSTGAFVMFGRRGRSWIALFDPVGPRNEWPELVWRFIERARAAGGRASFYQVRPQALPLYLDAGLRLFKLGEYAHVSLPDFSLKGPHRANLRQTVNRAEREGLVFELVPPAAVPDAIPELEAISDAWLRERHAAEKGFSLGSFDEPYLRRHPVARVRHQGRCVAFATLMTTGRKVEASVDLMRQLPDAPRGVMDFMFTRLMMHFQAEGFERFGLGMAPLAGLAGHPLAPSWHRIGRLLFAHGEHFYNFQGLRAFKEKFDPQWEPRYLAAPGGLVPLIVLADVAVLIGGGLRKVIAK